MQENKSKHVFFHQILNLVGWKKMMKVCCTKCRQRKQTQKTPCLHCTCILTIYWELLSGLDINNYNHFDVKLMRDLGYLLTNFSFSPAPSPFRFKLISIQQKFCRITFHCLYGSGKRCIWEARDHKLRSNPGFCHTLCFTVYTYLLV